MDWRPYAIGLCAAFVIIASLELGHRFFGRHPPQRWLIAVFLGVMSLVCGAGTIVLWPKGIMYVLMMGLCTLVLGWGALGTLLKWPGFRDPIKEEESEGWIPARNLQSFLTMLAEIVGCDLRPEEWGLISRAVETSDIRGDWVDREFAGTRAVARVSLARDTTTTGSIAVGIKISPSSDAVLNAVQTCLRACQDSEGSPRRI